MIPRNSWMVRLIVGVAGLALQLAGLYAACVAFGAWITFALYTVGGLVLLLHAVVVRRLMPWSAGLIVFMGLWLILADVSPVTGGRRRTRRLNRFATPAIKATAHPVAASFLDHKKGHLRRRVCASGGR